MLALATLAQPTSATQSAMKVDWERILVRGPEAALVEEALHLKSGGVGLHRATE